jgi:hypothetical protein
MNLLKMLGTTCFVPRDLVKTVEHKRSEWYHVDACQYQAGMAYQFTGLAQLIQDTPPALKLRRLLIDL